MRIDEPLRRLLGEVNTACSRLPHWEDEVVHALGPDGAAIVARGKHLGLIYARGSRLSLTHRGYRYHDRLLWGPRLR